MRRPEKARTEQFGNVVRLALVGFLRDEHIELRWTGVVAHQGYEGVGKLALAITPGTPADKDDFLAGETRERVAHGTSDEIDDLLVSLEDLVEEL